MYKGSYQSVQYPLLALWDHCDGHIWQMFCVPCTMCTNSLSASFYFLLVHAPKVYYAGCPSCRNLPISGLRPTRCAKKAGAFLWCRFAPFYSAL